jgi:hypothetical protein
MIMFHAKKTRLRAEQTTGQSSEPTKTPVSNATKLAAAFVGLSARLVFWGTVLAMALQLLRTGVLVIGTLNLSQPAPMQA